MQWSVRHSPLTALSLFLSDVFSSAHVHASASHSGWQLDDHHRPSSHVPTECSPETGTAAVLFHSKETSVPQTSSNSPPAFLKLNWITAPSKYVYTYKVVSLQTIKWIDLKGTFH